MNGLVRCRRDNDELKDRATIRGDFVRGAKEQGGPTFKVTSRKLPADGVVGIRAGEEVVGIGAHGAGQIAVGVGQSGADGDLRGGGAGVEGDGYVVGGVHEIAFWLELEYLWRIGACRVESGPAGNLGNFRIYVTI